MNIICFNSNTGAGGTINLRAGTGNIPANNGKIIIKKLNNTTMGELTFEGTSSNFVALRPIYNGSTLTLGINSNGTTLTPISTATTLAALTDVSLVNPVNSNILMYNGVNWTNAVFSFGAPVNVVSPQVNDVLKYNGTQWVNTPLISQETIVAVGGGADVNPDVSKNITMITTTGTGIATGKLNDGLFHGMLKNITASNLATNLGVYTIYRLDVSTNTTFTSANGSIATYIDFMTTGNGSTLLWNQNIGSWFIANAGLHIQ